MKTTLKLMAAAIAVMPVFGLAKQSLSAQTREQTAAYNKMIRETGNFSKEYMNFEAAYIDGRAVSSESLKGVNVLYVFGHSTCTPCIAIGRIMKTLKDEKKYAESDLRFVFLTDDGKEGQDILVQRYGIDPAMMVYLPEDKYEEVGIIGPMRPVTLLVDRDGKVVFKIAGGPDPRDPAVALGQFNKTITPEIEKLLTSQRK